MKVLEKLIEQLETEDSQIDFKSLGEYVAQYEKVGQLRSHDISRIFRITSSGLLYHRDLVNDFGFSKARATYTLNSYLAPYLTQGNNQAFSFNRTGAANRLRTFAGTIKETLVPVPTKIGLMRTDITSITQIPNLTIEAIVGLVRLMPENELTEWIEEHIYEWVAQQVEEFIAHTYLLLLITEKYSVIKNETEHLNNDQIQSIETYQDWILQYINK